MYQTRRQLKSRIRELEDKLNAERSYNVAVKESGLAKGKGILCKACSHAVYAYDQLGTRRFIGCDVSVSCNDFSKITSAEKQSN